jgi:hypothetical protein
MSVAPGRFHVSSIRGGTDGADRFMSVMAAYLPIAFYKLMSAIGTKQTCSTRGRMSALGAKRTVTNRRLQISIYEYTA